MTWLNGDRAVTIMMATIQNRRTIKDVACELSTDTQLLFSTQKIDGQWYIVRFESIYEQDRLIPVLPDATLSMDVPIRHWANRYEVYASNIISSCHVETVVLLTRNT